MRTVIRQAASIILCWASVALAATPPSQAPPPTDLEAQSRALERASQAVVGVQALALDGARSSLTLGRLRQGSGVVIGPDGLVLTIGYLILEADQVQLVLDDERAVPARVVGYDLATGFGLLQPLAPLRIAPAPLGGSRAVSSEEPLLVASGGDSGQLSTARLVARRSFAGYWEYRIDDALFTAPPRTDHSGRPTAAANWWYACWWWPTPAPTCRTAACANRATCSCHRFAAADPREPRTRGTSSASRCAWLGELRRAIRRAYIVRITLDSSSRAGLRIGDCIVAIDARR
jgi:hypothetical protein